MACEEEIWTYTEEAEVLHAESTEYIDLNFESKRLLFANWYVPIGVYIL